MVYLVTLVTLGEFQARLVHLGVLAEELPGFAATPGGTWLYRQISTEVDQLAIIAWEYWMEAEKARHAIERRYGVVESGGSGGDEP